MIAPLKIGHLTLKNPLILAPMAGYTDLAFRLLCRRYGASLAFTEMISGPGLMHSSKKTFEMLKTSPEDTPFAVQLFGSDPKILSEAAKIIEQQGADLIDLNCGCPVKKVIKQDAGSALMNSPEKLLEIVHALTSAVKIPVTIKIRAGKDENSINVLEIAEKLKGSGLSAITLHPRTVAEPYKPKPKWELLKQLKAIVDFPVIGSGGLMTADNIKEIFEQTGVDGVMLARGALGHPWIFECGLKKLRGETHVQEPDNEHRAGLMQEHLSMMIQQYGEMPACRMFRAHTNYYVDGWHGAAQLRAQLNQITSLQQMQDIFSEYFHQ